jgi:hypothetical protein
VRNRNWWWWTAAIFVLAGIVGYGCAEDDKKDEPPQCRQPLEAWLNTCGYAINLDGLNEMSFDEAYDSCRHGYGKLWEFFIHCYNEVYRDGGSCEAFAECVPKHGFISDDDDDDDNDDDDNDDTSPPDDDTSPADDDTSPAA